MPEYKQTANQTILNVGGHSKIISIPKQYDGWQHDILDIDPSCKPEILCDARAMHELDADMYDVVYCSHNLEHYYLHDARKVLSGFIHVLKKNGYAHIVVPDIAQLMKTAVESKLDVLDVLYKSPMGPIRVCDVLYGHQGKIETTGEEYYAHKMGFTPKSLQHLLLEAGFKMVAISQGNMEVRALAFFEAPDENILKKFTIAGRR